MSLFKRPFCLSIAAAMILSLSSCMFDGTPIKDNSEVNATVNGSVNSAYIAHGSISNVESQPNESGNKYPELAYTSDISEKELRVFNEIYNGIMNYRKEISITPDVIAADDMNDFLTFVTSAAPEIHQLSDNYGLYTDENGYVTGLEMQYSRNKERGQAELVKLNRKIDEIYKNASSLSDFDKLKYFHDYIIRNCTYDTQSKDIYSAFGCLMNGKAVCEGYSKAFAMLCSKAGIPCINIMGDANDENGNVQSHMWNMVKLDNDWYHFDVTWDDPKNIFDSDYIRYDYFNVSDDMIRSDHKATTNAYMQYPKALKTDRNYFITQGLFLFNDSDNKSMIEYAVKKGLSESGKYIRFRCESEEKFRSVINEMFNSDDNNAGFFTLLGDIVDSTGAHVSKDEYSIVQNTKTKVITIQLKSK